MQGTDMLLIAAKLIKQSLALLITIWSDKINLSVIFGLVSQHTYIILLPVRYDASVIFEDITLL